MKCSVIHDQVTESSPLKWQATIKVNHTVMKGDQKRSTDLLYKPFHFPSLGSFYFGEV